MSYPHANPAVPVLLPLPAPNHYPNPLSTALYQLIPIPPHRTFQITFTDPGVQAYVFTFG